MDYLVVDTVALNFRSAPYIKKETYVNTLYLGQKVTNIKKIETEGWVSCVAIIEEKEVKGFVSSKYLRSPIGKNCEKFVASVHNEWMRFHRGLGKEARDPYYKYVGEMWQSIGINLDGTDTDTPWSAAAISYMVRNAGDAYKNFKFAAAHSKFVHHAIQARFNKDNTVPFWGYSLDEVVPEVGDIICRDNPNYAPRVDFDIAKNRSSYRSHTDVIMQVDTINNKIIAIGGNVSNSVKVAYYDLTSGNYADDTHHTFAILKNITDVK